MLLWFRKPPVAERQTAEALYGMIVAQARQPVFYRDLSVPDTLDGRFDMILLHSFMILTRLREGGEGMQNLAQTIYDVMFVDMDRSVREMGIGDLSVGRHVRRMMKAFNGRMAAYEAARGDDAAMCDALRRNLYGTVKEDVSPEILQAMAGYVARSAERMGTMPLEMLVVGGQSPWAAVDEKAAQGPLAA